MPDPVLTAEQVGWIETLARQICVCGGDDPDTMTLPSHIAIPRNSSGDLKLSSVDAFVCPAWLRHAETAEKLILDGWRKIDTSAG